MIIAVLTMGIIAAVMMAVLISNAMLDVESAQDSLDRRFESLSQSQLLNFL